MSDDETEQSRPIAVEIRHQHEFPSNVSACCVRSLKVRWREADVSSVPLVPKPPFGQTAEQISPT